MHGVGFESLQKPAIHIGTAKAGPWTLGAGDGVNDSLVGVGSEPTSVEKRNRPMCSPLKKDLPGYRNPNPTRKKLYLYTM